MQTTKTPTNDLRGLFNLPTNPENPIESPI